MRRLVAVLIAVTCALGQPLLSQRPPAEQGQEGKVVGAKPLDRKAVAAKLEKFLEGIGEKVLPDRIRRRGVRKVDAWKKSFQVVQSKHYLLYTNGPTATSRKFAKSLEKLYSFIQKRFPFDDLSHHLECYIFNTKDEYFDFCVKVVGWSMASAKGTAGHAMSHYYATYYQSPTANVVMHEAAHQIVGACLKVPGVGSWFQEGFAVYVEKSIGNSKVSSTQRSQLKIGHFYSLRKMVGLSSLLGDTEGRRNYAQAGTILDFMINTKLAPMRGKFPTFLKAARRGYGRGTEVTDRLFKQVYGLSIDEVGALWKKHFRVPNAIPGQRPGRKKKTSK